MESAKCPRCIWEPGARQQSVERGAHWRSSCSAAVGLLGWVDWEAVKTKHLNILVGVLIVEI